MNRRGFLKTAGGAGLGAAAMTKLGPEVWAQGSDHGLKTKHIILIMNGNGARKKEYYEREDVAIKIRPMLEKSTVFEEDHGTHVSNHGYMFTEYLTGLDVSSDQPMFPTFQHYARKANGDAASNYWYVNPVSYYRQWRFHRKYYTSHPDFGQETRGASLQAHDAFYDGQDMTAAEIVKQQFTPDMDLTAKELSQIEDFVDGVQKDRLWEPKLETPYPQRTPHMQEGHALALVPHVLQEFKPRIITVQMVAHDTGHGAGGYLRDETGYLDYSDVARSTDEMFGQIYDFVRNDPYFSTNTAIVIRPETGRDDEVNLYGEIHHSDGYYYAHRPASVWFGPDFKEGVRIKDVVNRMDMAPTLAWMMGAEKTMAKGHVRNHMFKDHVTGLPEYKSISHY
jgi:hypothetical protein